MLFTRTRTRTRGASDSCRALRQVDQVGPRGGVVGVPWCAGLPRNTRHRHDRRAIAQERDRGVQDVEGAVQIGRHDQIPFGGGQIGELRDDMLSGAEDQDVEAADLGPDRDERRSDRRRIAQSDPLNPGASSCGAYQLCGRPRASAVAAITGDNIGPLSGQELGGGRADSARRAGDQGQLIA